MAADEIRAELFEAQAQLLFGEGEGEGGPVARAGARLRGPLREGLATDAPRELREVEAGLAAARQAIVARDEAGLAAARGAVVAALRRGAMVVAIASARRDEPARARIWLQIRDFRKPTRFTRPGVDGTAAIQEARRR